MPEQKIILSVIGQVLAGIKDNELLKFLKMVNGELGEIITEFDEVRQLTSEEMKAVCEVDVYDQ